MIVICGVAILIGLLLPLVIFKHLAKNLKKLASKDLK